MCIKNQKLHLIPLMYFSCAIFSYMFRPVIHLQGDISVTRIHYDQMCLLYNIGLHIIIG